MFVAYSDKHLLHAPKQIIFRGRIFDNVEAPARATELAAAARAAGCQLAAPREFGLEPVLSVHTSAYVEFLQTAYARWRAMFGDAGAGPSVVPHASPTRFPARLPQAIQGQVGYFLAGTSAPIEENTWPAIQASADCALEVSSRLLEGMREGYAICRPAGHHAYADVAGGYCYLNNAAIAAEQIARRQGKVAVLDIDVHHGNGTQNIFYRRGDVLFVSIHGDPNEVYPFYSGYADEQGEDDGKDCNLNLPLPKGSKDAGFLEALNVALAAITRFGAPSLVLSLGFDAHEDDPQSEMAVTNQCFYEVGLRIATLGLATAIIQEGGYYIPGLASNLTAFLDGFKAGRT
ncbi:histone deacetylase family protein [Bradyrhizobium sp. CSS354]|uniref:histone deacetylase family protein n=1 Tax=Bradyrhizobium sp. CSS354 TaxID=2699172 RepID=UPI0023AEEE25|nr:histone deacetylase family protein [Bradyrhizobium sp. CSS354]MDE5466254.1 histone deacetylase family protein [Bradyrhizobium sp. CSS354]